MSFDPCRLIIITIGGLPFDRALIAPIFHHVKQTKTRYFSKVIEIRFTYLNACDFNYLSNTLLDVNIAFNWYSLKCV